MNFKVMIVRATTQTVFRYRYDFYEYAKVENVWKMNQNKG